MSKKFSLIILFFTCLACISMGQGKAKALSEPELRVKEGICYFNDLKIGDKYSKVEDSFGKALLITTDYSDNLILFFPDYGIKIYLKGEIVAAISLFPKEGISMGEIKGFEIVSRNIFSWKLNDLLLKGSQPQDVMEVLGSGTTNALFGNLGYPLEKVSNSLKYTLTHSGGEQKLSFTFAYKDPGGQWKASTRSTSYGAVNDQLIIVSNAL